MAHSICRNLTETGLGFGGFIFSICESETRFRKPWKPARKTVSLANMQPVQLSTLIAVDEIMIKKYDVFILRQV